MSGPEADLSRPQQLRPQLAAPAVIQNCHGCNSIRAPADTLCPLGPQRAPYCDAVPLHFLLIQRVVTVGTREGRCICIGSCCRAARWLHRVDSTGIWISPCAARSTTITGQLKRNMVVNRFWRLNHRCTFFSRYCSERIVRTNGIADFMFSQADHAVQS